MRKVVAGVLAILGLASPAGPSRAQQQPMATSGLPRPRITIVAPAGAKAGGVVEVAVTGSDVDGPRGLLFSDPGITAEPIGEATAVPIPRGVNNRQRIVQGPQAPLFSQKFKVTVPADAPRGILDVRLVGDWGVSNPRAFVVGDLIEADEGEPNDDVPQARRVELGTTVNGAISGPTDVDDVIFEGKAGQRVIVSGLASSIDSRLLLGLELYDGSGKRLAENHEYQGTDALLDATLPSDGDYLVRAFAFTYSDGGPEHFYRLSIATAPWIDAVFPSVVEPGRTAKVTVHGRNLPGGRPDPSALVGGRVLEILETTVRVPGDPKAIRGLAYNGLLANAASALDGFEFRLRNEAGTSNPFLLTFADAPVVLDRGGNETPGSAQPIEPPCEIAGRIEAKRDRDWYAFEARKGDTFTIEAFGERIGSPLDLYFVIRDLKTSEVLAEVDDSRDAAQPIGGRVRGGEPPLAPPTADPDRYRFVAPRDGRYALLVSSREASIQAGPRHVYRVRIAREQPDFRLVVMPSSGAGPEGFSLRGGGQGEASVLVWRLDGFNDEIALGAEGLPPGGTCPPQVVGTGQKRAILVLAAEPGTGPWAGPITITGTATIGGRTVVREARSATITWPRTQLLNQQQQSIPAISRLDRGLALAVGGEAPFRLTAGVAELSVMQGEKATIPLMLERYKPDPLRLGRPQPEFKGTVQVTAADPPANLSINLTSFFLNRDEATIKLDVRSSATPGAYSLVFRGQAQVDLAVGSNTRRNTTITLPSTPVTLTILPRKPAK